MNEFEKIFSLIHNEIKPNVGYVQFKKTLIVYSEEIMKNFLNGKSKCICHIEPLKNGLRGTANYNEETKTWTKSYSYDFQAKSDVTVSEIGVCHCPSGYSGASVLVYREVLEQPVSLTTGQYLKVTITTTVSANPNKPADVSAIVETV